MMRHRAAAYNSYYAHYSYLTYSFWLPHAAAGLILLRKIWDFTAPVGDSSSLRCMRYPRTNSLVFVIDFQTNGDCRRPVTV